MSDGIKLNCGSCGCGIPTILYLAMVVYTFIVWGVGWGLMSIVFPIFPIIDVVKWLITQAPWL